jgi:hypothetical protein
MDGIHGQARFTVSLRDLVGQRCSHCTISVDDITLNSGGQALVEGQFGLGYQFVVQSNVEAVVLLSDIESCNTGSELVRRSKDQRQVDIGGLRSAKILSNPQVFSVANHLIDSSEAELGHDSTQFIGDVVEEVNDVLWGTRELFPKLRILGGDTNGAGVLYKVLA